MVNVQYMAIVAIIISNNAGKSSIATRVLTFNFDFSDWKFFNFFTHLGFLLEQVLLIFSNDEKGRRKVKKKRIGKEERKEERMKERE